jgi:hypothetical protein
MPEEIYLERLSNPPQTHQTKVATVTAIKMKLPTQKTRSSNEFEDCEDDSW